MSGLLLHPNALTRIRVEQAFACGVRRRGVRDRTRGLGRRGWVGNLYARDVGQIHVGTQELRAFRVRGLMRAFAYHLEALVAVRLIRYVACAHAAIVRALSSRSDSYRWYTAVVPDAHVRARSVCDE